MQIWRGQSFAHLLRAVSRKGEGLCSSIAGEGSVYGSMASSIGLSLSCSMMYACMSAGGAGCRSWGLISSGMHEWSVHSHKIHSVLFEL